MKKNLLLRFSLILLVAFSAYSCRTDQFPEKETYTNSSKFQLTSRRISLNEAKHKTKLLPEITKVEAEFKAKNTVQGKVVSYGNGISVDTDHVIYIENGPNYFTYTFRIQRENAPEDAPVENLVLSPLSDGSWKEELVTYNLTVQERQIMLSGGAVDLTGKVTKELLQNGTYAPGIMQKSVVCYDYVDAYYTTCSGGLHHNGEEYGPLSEGKCPESTQSVLVITVTRRCNDSGSTGSGNEGGTTPGGFNPGGGGGGTNPFDPTDDGGGTNPNQPCEEIPTQPQDPNSTLGGNEGCNGGTPTLPIIEFDPSMREPCSQLKQIGENTNIKAKFTTLKNNINGTNEKGILIRDVVGNETSNIIDGDGKGNIYYPYNTNDPYYYQTYGTAHNHLKNDPDHISIFTPEDLFQLVGNAMIEMNPNNPNASSTPKKSVIFVMTDKGFFALKITDVLKLADFIVWYDNMTKKERKKYIDEKFSNPKDYNITSKSSHDEQVTGFLRFMQDKDIGVELYEGNKDTFSNWKKLQLVDNGNKNYSFSETPCNL